MKKKIMRKVFPLALCAFFVAASSAYANWSYSDYSHGSYVPKEGTTLFFYESSTSEIHTTAGFDLDQNNVNSILNYNNGDGAGDCSGQNAYLTVDFHAIPENSLDLEIGADTLTTNLPDPKIDFDSWSNGDWDISEAEVTTLGTVQVDNYWVRVDWDDFRDGDSNDGGRIQLQFAMSALGFLEYNNCIQSDVIQETFYYGDDFGSL